MKLPTDTEIDMRKLTHYLLVPQMESDKSAWLARGGYTLLNPQRLMDDIRSQLLPLDAIPSRPSPFGDAFEIRGGPHRPFRRAGFRALHLAERCLVRSHPLCYLDSHATEKDET